MNDEWGHDPSVRLMREVFKGMEIAQKEFLAGLHILPFDERLRPCREMARRLFERSWALAARQGRGISEEEAGLLYVHCLARTLRSQGFDVPTGILPDEERIASLLREVLR